MAMSGESTLQRGDSGEEVTHLQELMRDAGFWQGDTNGTFDDDLEQAVQTMQGAVSLPQTGVVDEDTWSALEQRSQSAQQPAQTDGSADTGQPVAQQDQGDQQTDTPTTTATDATSDTAAGTATDTSNHPTLSKGDDNSGWVQYLQQVMQHVGYWNGAVDGTFGDDLEQAVQTLQTGNGLPQSGVVDTDTWSLLDRLQQPPAAAESDQQVDTMTRTATDTTSGSGDPATGGDSTAEYDPEAWNTFLAQNGPHWSGDDTTWEHFRTWFADQAGRQGLADPAAGFLTYVESQQDKTAAFAAYGVTIATSTSPGDGAGSQPLQTPDPSTFPETKPGDTGEWVAYLDAMLTSNGY